MPTLHIITNPADPLPLHVIEQGGDQTTIVLMQDGVYRRLESANVCACAEDVRARGLETPHRLVSAEEIIDLIISHDKVICWH